MPVVEQGTTTLELQISKTPNSIGKEDRDRQEESQNVGLHKLIAPNQEPLPLLVTKSNAAPSLHRSLFEGETSRMSYSARSGVVGFSDPH